MILKRVLPLIGLVLLGFLIVRTGPSNIVNSFLSVKPFYLFVAVAMIPVILFLQALKLNTLLHSQNIFLPFWYVFKLHLIGLFYGSITPGKIGSFVKVAYLKKKTGKGTGECTPAVLFDKIIDLVAVGVLAALGAFFFLEKFLNFQLEIFLVLAGFILVTFALVNKKTREFFVKKIFKIIIPKTIEGDVVGFSDNIPSWKKLLKPFLIGGISWLLIYTQLYFFGLAFSVNVPYFYFITMFPIATLVGLIPITIAGLGTREITAIGLFSIFLVPKERIISMSIVALSFTYLQSLLGWFFAVKKEH